MAEPVTPWGKDTEPMTNELVELVTRLPRERLDRVDAPNVSGCYLQFFATTNPTVTSVLGSFMARGCAVAYVGVATLSLRERVGRYRQSVEGIVAVNETDIYLALLPCASAGWAAHAELDLIGRLSPPLQGLGWGAKMPGRNRTGRCSPIDALFRGRRWAAVPSLTDQAAARMQVVSNLARLDPDGARWPPLVPAARLRAV